MNYRYTRASSPYHGEPTDVPVRGERGYGGGPRERGVDRGGLTEAARLESSQSIGGREGP
jgi:hypothetical protein